MKMAIHLRRAAALVLLVTASVVAIPSGPAQAGDRSPQESPSASPAKSLDKGLGKGSDKGLDKRSVERPGGKPPASRAVSPPVNRAEAVPDSYVVVLKQAPPVAATSKRLTTSFGGAVVRTFGRTVRGFELAGGAATAQRMAADPAVAYVQPNHRFRVTDVQSPTPSWGLDRVDQRSDLLDDSYTYATGAGNVRAYVLDTGIRTTHQDFEGRVRSGFDAIDGGTADDCHGHGTHVAGTIGGVAHGVAKAVSLVAVRVLDCDGYGTTAQVVAGIDWVTADHAAGVPAVANMSLGGDVDQVIDDAVAASIADGISYAVAAGNEDGDSCTRSPARTPAAITVAATGSFFGEGDERAWFSSFGTCVDIFAPGVEIVSSYNTSDSATESLSGTSMAAPHVAGAAALLLAQHPTFTPDQVRNSLVDNATEGVVDDPGAGSPNALLYVDSTPPANDFSVSVDPVTGTVDPGAAITATVRTATTAGAAQTVTLSVNGLPAGVSATFTPAVVTSGGTSSLHISAASTVPPGGYPLRISGTGGLASVIHRADYSLVVNGPPGCISTVGADVTIADLGTVESTIPIHGCSGQASALSTVEVHIVHSWTADLQIQLIAPDGSSYVLFENSSGSGNGSLDLTSTLDLSSEVASGLWRLRVQDVIGGDSGYLDSWTLNLSSPTPVPGCTGSNQNDVLVPDLSTVTSAVVISGCARNGTATSSVAVRIVHWYIGDLVVTLIAPDGSTYVLHDRAGGGTDNIDRSYTVNLSSEAADGVWRLRVQDASGGADGYLDGWSLTL